MELSSVNAARACGSSLFYFAFLVTTNIFLQHDMVAVVCIAVCLDGLVVDYKTVVLENHDL
ncbi:conserved hypothetical protein [Ricinus communis]|uniref:Uncharacterized protein n=1 Tax=Ricinus communis TaxID=3988 RepID=B9S5E0_RICCO|nr:conserved hypothetical protein [Ricinus communis]